MKTTKFRAWDVVEKCWIPQEVLAIAAEGGRILTYEESEDRWCDETIPIVLVWFSGRLDIKGQEIYEGHIVRCHSNKCLLYIASMDPSEAANPLGLVIFDEECAAFSVRSIDGKEDDYICNVEPEIVGNIFENADLLPQERVESFMSLFCGPTLRLREQRGG